MAIDPEKLQGHLKDYAKVTGLTKARFVCPITLHECAENELIDGHILNKKLHNASRKTVIQCKRVDNFFGSRVEPAVVRFFSELATDDRTLLKHQRPFEIVFADGTNARVFACTRSAPADDVSNLTRIEVPTDYGTLAVMADVGPDDPRLQEKVKIGFQSQFRHFDWVAAMLKAGFLTWFDMIGYRAVFDPFGEAVRSTLARYFKDNAKPREIDEHFGEFRYAIKILGSRQDGSSNGRLQALNFDTLNDRCVLFHKTTGGVMIATTCLFAINGQTATVTLPLGLQNSDVGAIWKLYVRLMSGESEVCGSTYRARYTGTSWQIEQLPLSLHW